MMVLRRQRKVEGDSGFDDAERSSKDASIPLEHMPFQFQEPW